MAKDDRLMPITTLQRHYAAVVRNLSSGPVFLSQRSHPVAVIMTPADYQKLVDEANEGKRLKRMAQYNQDFAEMNI